MGHEVTEKERLGRVRSKMGHEVTENERLGRIRNKMGHEVTERRDSVGSETK